MSNCYSCFKFGLAINLILGFILYGFSAWKWMNISMETKPRYYFFKFFCLIYLFVNIFFSVKAEKENNINVV